MKKLITASVIILFAVVVKAQTPVYQSTFHIGGASDSTQLPAASASGMQGKEVKVNNGLDPGDCTKGGGSYVVKCTSDGAIWKPSPAAIAAVDVRTFGAKCDDSTNDASAIQAAIDSLGTTSATRGGAEIVIPGPCAIGSTLLIDRKSIVFRGLGWGRVGATGAQSYLRWIGSAGSPMLKATNIYGLQISDLRFIGNVSAKPSSAISLYQGSAVATSANVLRNILIGMPSDETAVIGFVDGIRMEGLGQSNSEWTMSNIAISGCSGSGLYQTSLQYSNTMIDGFWLNFCTKGLNNVGQVVGQNWSFANNGTDIYFRQQDDFAQTTYPQVIVKNFGSEASGRLWEVEQEGLLSLDGGIWVGSGLHADGRIVKSESNGHRTLRLTDFTLAGGGAGYIEFKSTPTGGGIRTLILDGMRSFPTGGPNSNGLDVVTRNRQDHAYIYFRASTDYTSPEYIPPHETKTFLYGVGGEDFRLDTFDIPARLRLIPDQFGQDITSASNTITADAAQKLIRNTTGSGIVLTSTPTISAGLNGDVLILTNIGNNGAGDPIVLQDRGTLASSKLLLNNYAPRLTLRLYQSATFVYHKTSFGVPDAWVLQQTNAGQDDQLFDAKSGTSYTFVAADNNRFVTSNNGSAVAWSLPQATGSFTTGWTVDVGNIGAGTVTITPTTSTIDATAIGGSGTATSVTLTTGKSYQLKSNGTNYVLYNYQGRY